VAEIHWKNTYFQQLIDFELYSNKRPKCIVICTWKMPIFRPLQCLWKCTWKNHWEKKTFLGIFAGKSILLNSKTHIFDKKIEEVYFKINPQC
jgi:hypothetical protein